MSDMGQQREKDRTDGKPVNNGGRYSLEAKDADTLGSLTTRPHQHETPIEVDTQLAELTGKAARQGMTVDSIARRKSAYEESIAKSGGGWSYYKQEDLDKVTAQLEDAVAELDAIRDAMVPFNNEFDARGGWTRAFLVTNNGGHVHNTTSCTTCFPTTQFAWLPEVSGKDEADIVELAGDAACTVCYPTAPVADKNSPRPLRLETATQREAREERDRKKSEREAKRIATGIWNPDGTPLREAGWRPGDYESEIKTERTAEIAAVDYLFNKNLYGREVEQNYDHAKLTYLRIIPALAAKRGVSEEEIIKTLREKANKKRKRDGFGPVD